MTNRYRVSPIASADCDSISGDIIVETDDLGTARWHALHNSCVYGAGILDTVTGELDVGFGFGVLCPDSVEG